MAYSQHGEEAVLLKHFAGRTGRLLDIGAFDGRAFSNSLALIEAGWSAVLVEPSARAFDKLMALHGGNPNVRLVQALVCAPHPAPPLTRFWQCGDALSTTEQKNLDTWHQVPFVETFTPGLSVMDLLAWAGPAAPFDFVNIDTEGTSVGIFDRLMAISPTQPEVLCVEHDGASVRYPGYAEIYFDGNNVILKRVR